MRFVNTMIVALSGLGLIQAVSAQFATLRSRCEHCGDKEYTQEEADARFADRYTASLYKRLEGKFIRKGDQFVPLVTAEQLAAMEHFGESERSGDESPQGRKFREYELYMA